MIGEFYEQEDLKVEIINTKNQNYINYSRKTGINKTGEVIYVYHEPREIKGRIGSFKRRYDFLKVWKRLCIASSQ